MLDKITKLAGANKNISDFHLRDGSSSGTIKFKCKTPASAEGITITFPAPILCKDGVYVNFTTEHVVAATVFHSGGNNN